MAIDTQQDQTDEDAELQAALAMSMNDSAAPAQDEDETMEDLNEDDALQRALRHNRCSYTVGLGKNQAKGFRKRALRIEQAQTAAHLRMHLGRSELTGIVHPFTRRQ